MDASELRQYLDEVCEDLDAGRPVRTWQSWARRLTLPAAFGVALAVGGCGSRVEPVPIYGNVHYVDASPLDTRGDGLPQQDGALYAAPFDAAYAAPFDAPIDTGGGADGGVDDGGADAPTGMLYMAPFDNG